MLRVAPGPGQGLNNRETDTSNSAVAVGDEFSLVGGERPRTRHRRLPTNRGAAAGDELY